MNCYIVQIMQMSHALHGLSVQRAQQLAAQAPPRYQAYIETAKVHSTALSTSLAALQAKSADANKRKADGQAFRGNHVRLCISWHAAAFPPALSTADAYAMIMVT